MKTLFVVVGTLWLGVLAALIWFMLDAAPDTRLMRLAAYSIAGWDLLAVLALRISGYRLPKLDW
jgi:hypothetical protein